MAALAPIVINSLLGNQMSGAVKPDLAQAVTEKASGSTKIVRKHYSDIGYHPHEAYHPHEEYHPHGDGYGDSEHTYVHHYNSGGGGYGKKKSRSVALTALTLLAFLFFLHILQSCLDHQMDSTTTTTAAPQIVIMQAKIQAARESKEKLAKEAQQREQVEAQTKAGEAQKRTGEFQTKAGEAQKRTGELQTKGGELQTKGGELQMKVGGAQRRRDELPEVVTEFMRWTTRATTKRHISPSMFSEGPDLYRYEKVPVKMKLIENYRRP